VSPLGVEPGWNPDPARIKPCAGHRIQARCGFRPVSLPPPSRWLQILRGRLKSQPGALKRPIQIFHKTPLNIWAI
jgi:hypothetical protein